MAERLFPNSQVSREGGRAAVVVRASYLDGLLRRVLPLGEGAQVQGPPRALARRQQMLRAVARRHGGGTR